MISEQLVDIVREHPEAERYQCVYERNDGPRRLGCAIAAEGPDLVILSLHVDNNRPDGETLFYGVVETVPVTGVTALASNDLRISMAVEAIRELGAGMRETLVESRLRAWAEINQNLGLAHHGFSVRIDLPALAYKGDIALAGRPASYV